MFLRRPFAASPLLARVAPFILFLALTFGQGQFGEASRYWFYLAKTLVGAWLILEMRPFVAEMRWAVAEKFLEIHGGTLQRNAMPAGEGLWDIVLPLQC